MNHCYLVRVILQFYSINKINNLNSVQFNSKGQSGNLCHETFATPPVWMKGERQIAKVKYIFMGLLV